MTQYFDKFSVRSLEHTSRLLVYLLVGAGRIELPTSTVSVYLYTLYVDSPNFTMPQIARPERTIFAI